MLSFTILPSCSFQNFWAENEERLIAFPEDTKDTFTTYLQWAFSDKLAIHSDEPTKDNSAIYYERLNHLYIFADKIGDKGLKILVIDNLKQTLAISVVVPPHTALEKAMAQTPEDCMLQRFYIDMYVFAVTAEVYKATAISECPIFYCRVLALVAATRQNSDLVQGLPEDRETKCFYHKRDEDTPACSQ